MLKPRNVLLVIVVCVPALLAGFALFPSRVGKSTLTRQADLLSETSIPLVFSYTASGEMDRPAAIYPDGEWCAIIEDNRLTVRDMSGKAIWVYQPPKTILTMRVVLGSVLPISRELTVVRLFLGLPDGVAVEETVLVALDGKGQPVWEKQEAGSSVFPSPTGETIFTSDHEYMKTEMLDAGSGRVLWTRRDVYGTEAQYSPDGRRVALFTGNRMVVLDINGKTLWTLPVGPLADMMTAGGGRLTLSYADRLRSGPGEMSSYDGNGKLLWRKDTRAATIRMNDSGSRILAIDGWPGPIRFLNPRGETVRESSTEERWGPLLWLSPDGDSVLFSSLDAPPAKLHLLQYDPSADTYESTYALWDCPKGSISLSADARRILVQTDDSVMVFDNLLLARQELRDSYLTPGPGITAGN